QSFLLAVPNRKCEHPTKMLHAITPIFFIEVNDHLCIAVGPKSVAACDQILSQRQLIIDFTVEDDPNCCVLITQRLMSMHDINDAHAPPSQPVITIDTDSFVIRATMNHRFARPVQKSGSHLPVTIKLQNASNSTHKGK